MAGLEISPAKVGFVIVKAREIAANREKINANDQKLVATTGALAATNARIGDLADYTTLGTVTVYFW